MVLSLAAILVLITAPFGSADTTPRYRLLVTAESDDRVDLVEFAPCEVSGCGARLVRSYPVGVHPVDIEGPHGVVAAPDGRSFFVTIAHGKPNGWLLRYDLESGALVGQAELGRFPATIDQDPAGRFLYAINFNFNDPEMKPSSLSIVHAATMEEMARVPTCRMPHGSRLDASGTRHYSGCMMDDLLVEVDAKRREVSRELALGPCSPTWAQPSADGGRVFVACNKSNEIVEVDVDRWSQVRRWPTPAAPYNLATTPDGKLLIATQKGPGTVTIWLLPDATLVAEIPGSRRVASGVAVSADSRFAFVTLEGVGDEPGAVDVIDLAKGAKVATVAVGRQAGGVAIVPDERAP